ncbi:DUF7525 family protein [Salinirussus salinus]|jgi:hypothetical protein|uniref:DUF7525 family protein n=1 Tax=Salinirussus salinus TaxID=1198300 RepID=UPI00135A5CF8|nr:hypothetical protein [Salinirussus salinus]
MAELAGRSDMGTGLAFVFGTIAVLAALVTTVSSYMDAVGGSDMQLVAGLGMAVAMLAGGLAIAALHVYE